MHTHTGWHLYPSSNSLPLTCFFCTRFNTSCFRCCLFNNRFFLLSPVLFDIVIFELAGVDEMCAKFITYIEFVCVDNSNCLPDTEHMHFHLNSTFVSHSCRSLSLSFAPYNLRRWFMRVFAEFRPSSHVTLFINDLQSMRALKWNSSTRIKHFLQATYRNSSGVAGFKVALISIYLLLVFCSPHSLWWVINNRGKCFWCPSISRLRWQIEFLWPPRSRWSSTNGNICDGQKETQINIIKNQSKL